MNALACANTPKGLDSLGAARPGAEHLLPQVEQFIRANDKAQRAFDQLSRRVEELKAELENTNQKLRDKVTELNRLSGHLVGVLHSMSDGVVALDAHGIVRFFNPAAERLTGKSSNAAIGVAAATLLGFDPQLYRQAEQALEGRTGQPRFRVNWPETSGLHRPLSVAVAPVFEGPGTIIGAVIVMQDLTEVTALHKRVFQVEKLAALGQMAAVVAHEIRNPLGGIQGYASLLQADLQHHPEQRRYAETIVEGTQSLNSLVTGLLTYAKPVDLKHELVDLAGLLKRVWELAKADPAFSRMAFRAVFDCDQVEPLVPGDNAALRQVFTNLIRNALEAMAPLCGGEVRLRLLDTELDGRPALAAEIADTGPGVPEKQRPYLFQPFMTTKKNGTGLGLCTLAKLVEAHGGEVTCHAEPDAGACFRVVLPRKQAE